MTPGPIDQRFIFKHNERLKSFIYLLLRDNISFGHVEKIFLDLGEHEHFHLDNQMMADYAQQCVNRLMPLVK